MSVRFADTQAGLATATPGQSCRFRDVGVSAASPRSTDMNTAIRCVRRHRIGDIACVPARRFRAHHPVRRSFVALVECIAAVDATTFQ
jgi:hypothetical protein